MTAEMTVSGDTPSVAGVQPVMDSMDAAATAPTRGSVGEIMTNAKADLTPAVHWNLNQLSRNVLGAESRVTQSR
jgi:hypothetical protein